LLHDFDINQKSAFFFGVEKDGLSNDVLDNADGFLKIPMVGFTESLNISVAAAIVLQDVTQRLKKSDVDWQLSAQEKEQLYLEWLEKSIKNIQQIKENYKLKNTI
jgi:tRNA (guanosine-2'-O-)-methyltransferase